jgi:Peptidase family M1 domain
MKNSLLLLFSVAVFAQKTPDTAEKNIDKFAQMYDVLATPNMYRTASGAPGPEYYQQQADYKIAIELDDKNTQLVGTETITYTNNARESLDYLWIQLDQNQHSRKSLTPLIESNKTDAAIPVQNFTHKYLEESFNGGFVIDYVKDALAKPMKYTINQTMMRIELDKPLRKSEKISVSIKWSYLINDYSKKGGRSGYEHFNDGNNLYVLAQFYPRMAVYNDVEGWQNMQFWGSGEFALPFGNFDVSITVPADHIVEATGNLQNRADVYTPIQLARWSEAEKSFDKPVIIVTQKEAETNEKDFATTKKTWKFKAENVRDFGIASSRKLILDAMAVKIGAKNVMAISVYPKEGNPLWEEYSTKMVAHTLKSYSKYTFDYPYPKAVSVNAKDQGMEYPMICWNYGRPDADGSYTTQVRNGMLSVVCHEVGHNFFPMIINSDERQWSWMDEGLNSFMQYLAEQSFETNYPSRRGPAKNIIPYMSGDQKGLEPIMTNSENIRQFGNNAYGKPATALAILRDVVMGQELFDYAFQTYAKRWKFKHPTPEDFFRTMEDASAVDLDWFWRGWFYTTDYNDIGIKEVKKYFVSNNATKEGTEFVKKMRKRDSDLGQMLYLIPENSEEYKPEMDKPFKIKDFMSLEEYISKNFTPQEQLKLKEPSYFYQVTFNKPGGLVMPILVEITFEDGSIENHQFPAQIWRLNDKEVNRTFATSKKISKIVIDPKLLTADIDVTNNMWPKETVKSKFD